MRDFIKNVFTGVFASTVYAFAAAILSFFALTPSVISNVPFREIMGWVPWLVFISSYLFLLNYEKIGKLHKYNIGNSEEGTSVTRNYRYTLWWGFGFAVIHYVSLFRDGIGIGTTNLMDVPFIGGFFIALDNVNVHLRFADGIIGFLGFAICYYGLYMAITARMYLDGFWTLHIVDNPIGIVKDGPYSICRHPIYSGQIIMVIGTALLSGEVLAYIFAVFVIYMNSQRATREEIALKKAKLPFPYEDYMKSTPSRFSILVTNG